MLSLDQAANMLTNYKDQEEEANKMKTKIRRLYDISNVLQSLNLIEKTNTINRKPGYKWLGYEGYKLFMNSYNQKAKNIFKITREYPKTEVKKPSPKYFNPRILLSSPNKKVKLDTEVENKENVSNFNLGTKVIIQNPRILTTLNLLLEVIEKMDMSQKQIIHKTPLAILQETSN